MKRIAIVTGILAFIVVLGVEILLQGFHFVTEREVLAKRLFQSDETQVSSANDVGRARFRMSPVYGYGLRDDWAPVDDGGEDFFLEMTGRKELPDYWYWSGNNYGFQSDKDYPFHAEGEDNFYVIVLGGSVANGLALDVADDIKAAVKLAPGYETQDVHVINLAQGGFKQPQQAQILAYMLSVGQPVDLVINMDGVNEAFLGYENIKDFGVEPNLPAAKFVYGLQNYFLTSQGQNFSEMSERQEDLRALDIRMQTTASALIHTITKITRIYKMRDKMQFERSIGYPVEGREYISLMPPAEFKNMDDFAQIIGGQWKRGSLVLDALSKSVGAGYIHVLQPSQYVGRRVFSEEERKLAFQDPPWQGVESVKAVYEVIAREKKLLIDRGVTFVDLTNVFDPYPEPFYFDSCCHFNTRGYRIIMEDVLEGKIIDVLGSR